MVVRRTKYVVTAGLAAVLLFSWAPPQSASEITFANFAPITIPASPNTSGVASPYPSPIVVSNVPGVIQSIEISIENFSHTHPDDLDIVLQGPVGAFMVMSDAGGSTDVGPIDLTFTDATLSLLSDTLGLISGTFRPTNHGPGDTLPGIGGYANPEPAGTETMTGLWRGLNPNGTWQLHVYDDAEQDVGNILGGWSITIVTVPPELTHEDPRYADRTVIRVASGQATWFMDAPFRAIPWGASGDHFLTGDFDGDRLSDVAVWRPSNGTFYVRRSSNGALMAQPWGLPGDDPVPGDYDGDGRTDFAVWRPSDGVWYVRRSVNGTLLAQPWGTSGDRTVRGDFDGDGKTDFAVQRNQGGNGVFHVLRSTFGYLAVAWGFGTDLPVPQDYDADGRTDIAVVRSTDGALFWYVRRSTAGSLLAMQLGADGDLPVPGNYFGDGKTEFAVWRPANGTFYLWDTLTSQLFGYPFGLAGDLPLPYAVLQ
jgi:hypothetical protein